VLASGSGSNLQAILDASTGSPEYGAEIVLVLSDVPGVKALSRAEDAGVPTAVVEWSDHPDRESFTRAVCDRVEQAGASSIVLRRFPGRILNIHPSILPAFPGAHAVPDALEYGTKLTGVTVHFVDEKVDHGPIILQEPVPVLADDDEATLHARIQEVEHRVYPEVVKAFAAGRLHIDGRKVVWT
jgi:phosphoribosylglycinamide formyltransferase-1